MKQPESTQGPKPDIVLHSVPNLCFVPNLFPTSVPNLNSFPLYAVPNVPNLNTHICNESMPIAVAQNSFTSKRLGTMGTTQILNGLGWEQDVGNDGNKDGNRNLALGVKI
jgi:hypothetical protein